MLLVFSMNLSTYLYLVVCASALYVLLLSMFFYFVCTLSMLRYNWQYLPIRARATLSFLLLPPLYWPHGRSRYWVRSTKLASFSSSTLIRFSELRSPRIRAKRVNISLPVNTLTWGWWGARPQHDDGIIKWGSPQWLSQTGDSSRCFASSSHGLHSSSRSQWMLLRWK